MHGEIDYFRRSLAASIPIGLVAGCVLVVALDPNISPTATAPLSRGHLAVCGIAGLALGWAAAWLLERVTTVAGRDLYWAIGLATLMAALMIAGVRGFLGGMSPGAIGIAVAELAAFALAAGWKASLDASW